MLIFKGTVSGIFKWPSMQRWQSLIYNGTLETLIWSKMWKIPSMFWLEKCLFLWGSTLLLLNNKYATHFHRENATENKHFIEIHILSLSEKAVKGTVVNRALTIDLLARRVTWKYVRTVPLSQMQSFPNNNIQSGTWRVKI